MITLRDRVLSNEQFGFIINNLIDSVNVSKDYQLVADSILDCDNLTTIEKSLLAATVDALCSKNNMKHPDWIFDKSTYLEKPYFSLNAKGKYRIVLLQESPKWFVSRNLFVSGNCLERV